MAIQHFATRALTSQTTSTWIRLDSKVTPFLAHIQVILTNSPNLTYSVEYTTDSLVDENSSATATALTDFAAQTAGLSKALIAPVTGVRLNVTAYTAGTATIQVRQSGVFNDA